MNTPLNKTPESIIERVRDAGVVGAAGLGFPTHLKLQAKVETVIVNGSECEPLLFTDKTLLKTKAEGIIEGLKLAMIATGAKEGVIAINCDDEDGIAAIKKVISAPQTVRSENIKIHLLGNYYPAGDEFLTVYDVTQKVIPENGTPVTVGVMVLNVLTTLQIYQAVNGVPTTLRMVTIAGEVKEPKVVSVPIGTPYSELIALAGGSRLKNYSVLEGGPMMGRLVSDLNEGIAKSTTGIVLLPQDHFVIRLKSSKPINAQSAEFTEFCPRHLLGHEIDPEATMLALNYQTPEKSQTITSAFLCSGCGICEIMSSDGSLASPKKIYHEYQKRLLKAGVKNPHIRSGFSVHSQFENRKLATSTLIMKLNLGQYVKKLSFDGIKEIKQVKIPLQKNAPSFPLVKIGQFIKRGDVIAENLQGSLHHASIHGQISAITDQFIEITGAA